MRDFPASLLLKLVGAEERTRTFTVLPPPAPQAGASANSATSAWGASEHCTRRVTPGGSEDPPLHTNLTAYFAGAGAGVGAGALPVGAGAAGLVGFGTAAGGAVVPGSVAPAGGGVAPGAPRPESTEPGPR